MDPLKTIDESKESNSAERNSKIFDHELSSYSQISNHPVSDNYFLEVLRGMQQVAKMQHQMNMMSITIPKSIESVAPQTNYPSTLKYRTQIIK